MNIVLRVLIIILGIIGLFLYATVGFSIGMNDLGVIPLPKEARQMGGAYLGGFFLGICGWLTLKEIRGYWYD